MKPAAILAAACLLLAPAGAADASLLEPYQMVRSLQLVQDRLADGDQAAMPMQRKLLEIIDARLRDAAPSDFDDQKNFRALFIYAMSGGNPATVRRMLSTLDLQGENATLGQGILSYMAGAYGATRQRLEKVDPLALQPEIGAFIGLIRGAVEVQDNPQAALRLFDDARLLAPGTLVEEAALRRSIAAAAQIGDTDRFLRASSQYVRRFLRSPYASQFAEAFVSGVVALHEKIDTAAVEEIVSGMDHERAHAIYLRIARQSAIDGYKTLLAFASRLADATQPAGTSQQDPRALLYSTVASVTSDNVEEVRGMLKSIDRTRLSTNDQQLLDAARKVAEQVLAHPSGDDAAHAPPASFVSGQPVPATTEADSAPIQTAAGGEQPPSLPVTPERGDEPGLVATDGFIGSTRERLDRIDKLLRETNDE